MSSDILHLQPFADKRDCLDVAQFRDGIRAAKGEKKFLGPFVFPEVGASLDEFLLSEKIGELDSLKLCHGGPPANGVSDHSEATTKRRSIFTGEAKQRPVAP